jgi:hypothetical protein
MGERASTTDQSRDLFGESPVRLPRNPIALPTEPPELKAAKALSAQLRQKRSRRDKQQVAHMICMNLISMLKQGARRSTLDK